MLSYTVYRGRSNAIILNLTVNGAPAGVLDEVEIAIYDGDTLLSTIDADAEEMSYADGALTMRLGLIDEIAGPDGLDDGPHLLEVTGYPAGDDDGIAFGTFQIYLRDWGGEINGS
jgi:hypothetical protein